MIKKLLLFGLLSCGIINLQAVVAVGDTVNSPATFQFSVGSAIYDGTNERLWTLSGQDTSSFSDHIQSYGIAFTSFIPIDNALNIPLTAYPYLTKQALITTIDSEGVLGVLENSVPNPLFGQAYSTVTFLGTALTLVNTASPQFVYLIQSVYFQDGAHGTSLADGSSILNVLDLGIDYQAKVIAGSGLGVMFIANAQGVFGSAPSNISFASVSTSYVPINDQYVECTGMKKQADQLVEVSSPVLTAGGNNLAAIGSSIAMYPSPIKALQMYIGLDVTAQVGVNSQAVGLFIAAAQQQVGDVLPSISFSSVIPDAIASAGLQTPVSASAGHQVAVSNMTTTVTSTGLSYFVTSHADDLGKQSISAMPMVTMSANVADNGMIASFDSIKQVFKIVGSTYRVQGFDQVIDDAHEIDSAGTAPVVARMQVGAGFVPLAAGQFIEQLVAQGDAVYITIKNAFGPESTPGMFKSQALFDVQGRVMSWSPWQRVAGTDDQMVFAIKNRATDATMYVGGAQLNTIEQTTWNTSTDLASCITKIQSEMPVNKGGIQGLVPVSCQTPDLANFSLVMATGNQSVVISQSGSLNTYGSIEIDTPQNTIAITNELGLNIGSVVTATFAHDAVNSNNWLFMAGDSGLAVLSNDTTGVAFNGQLANLAALIAPGMSCKTLGNFKFIKKIVSDHNFVYVLTLDGVYRIALTADKFQLINPASLDLQVVVSASTIDKFASCLDMLVDNNLMILGTTAGLYSIDLSGGLPATPTSITIPGGLSAVSRLVTISNDANFDQKFYDSSNLYVLTINYGLQQARLNRFTISDGIITPIQDQLLQGQNGPLLIFDYMSNNIFIDGSLGFATSYRIRSIPPAVKYMEYTLQAGKSSTQVLLAAHTANLSIAALVNSLGITAIARDYASGCLMLAADFGLLTDS